MRRYAILKMKQRINENMHGMIRDLALTKRLLRGYEELGYDPSNSGERLFASFEGDYNIFKDSSIEIILDLQQMYENLDKEEVK